MRPRIVNPLACLAGAAILAVLGLALFAEAYAGGAKKPATDVLGDPLPDGALMRMGSMRWRHGDPITFLAYPPNGKTLITAAGDATLLIWERKYGKLLHRLTPPTAEPGGKVALPGGLRTSTAMLGMTRAALSNDGKLLAVVLPNATIQLWEVETGKAVRQFKGPANGALAMTFSPDDKWLAVRGTDRFTHVIDPNTGNELHKLKAEQPGNPNRVFFGGVNASAIAFSQDGKSLAIAEMELANNRISNIIAFFDPATGKEIRRIDALTNTVNSLAFSPDGKQFAYNGNNMIHVRAADTDKEIRQFNSNFGANLMVFAPDSKTVAIKGRDQFVRLYDASTGKLLRTFGAAPGPKAVVGFVNYNNFATADVVFSPDSKTIVIGGSQAPRFFDVETAKELALPSGELPSEGHKGAVSNVIASPDGKTLLSRGADNTIRIWNADTGAELRQFPEPAGTCCVAFSPDAKLVALANADGTIRLIGIADGKQRHQLKGHPSQTAALAFSADGKKLASRGGYDGILRIFDVEKGAELKQITWQTINAGNNGGAFLVRAGNLNNGGGQPLLFSPDGQSIVTYIAPQQVFLQGQPQMQPGSNTLRFWDAATGKEIRQIELPTGRTINHLVYSPDGRLLISENTDKTVSIWEAASGRERNHLGQPITANVTNTSAAFVVVNGAVRNGQTSAPAGATIAISPDGSLVASPGPNHSVRVWDAALGKEVGSFKGHNGEIGSLAFTPDGKRLISGSKDTTILVWGLARLKREPRPAIAELQPKEIQSLWTDLIGNDAGVAGKSIHRLIASPKSSVAFLKEHVKPATPVDAKKIDQWIVELNSGNFTKRSIAISQLEKLGELAIPALQKALAGNSPLETRRRVEPLLEKLTSGSYSAEQIRILRAIEVLDKIATPEARQWLDQLAAGAPGALTTRQAQAALDRYSLANRRP